MVPFIFNANAKNVHFNCQAEFADVASPATASSMELWLQLTPSLTLLDCLIMEYTAVADPSSPKTTF
jgi:hypothetical protein